MNQIDLAQIQFYTRKIGTADFTERPERDAQRATHKNDITMTLQMRRAPGSLANALRARRREFVPQP